MSRLNEGLLYLLIKFEEINLVLGTEWFLDVFSRNMSETGVDPTKLFFFANEEFFRFLLVSLRLRYIQKKNYL